MKVPVLLPNIFDHPFTYTSKEKLKKCVKHFNQEDLSFVIHLGDFIDRNFSSFDEILPIYNSLHAPGYHVLGNHDFEVADEYKELVPKKLGMPSKYYDFKIKNWRFICLDGNDLSFIDAFFAGAFTVPGDGCIDYKLFLKILKGFNYKGWLVVEAEQDPAKANPFKYAKIGYNYLSKTAKGCGFNIIS